jgi:hypothetical protein
MFCWCLLLFLLAINFLARTDPAKNEVYKNCDTEQKEEGGLAEGRRRFGRPCRDY